MIALIPEAIQIVLLITAIIMIFYVFWGGYTYAFSKGDQGKAEKAKKTIKYSIVGMVINITSYTLINTIITILGQNLVNLEVLRGAMIITGIFVLMATISGLLYRQYQEQQRELERILKEMRKREGDFFSHIDEQFAADKGNEK